jgi:uncharacterized membrane protein YphA (DoxX/SURF4 family)
MLNPFPELLVYGLIAPFIVRLALGSSLLYLAVEHYRGRRDIAELLRPLMGRSGRGVAVVLSLFELIAGALLLVGAWTQLAALLAMALTLKPLFLKAHLKGLMPYEKTTYGLMFLMAFSLLLSGAGAFAFDIPL